MASSGRGPSSSKTTSCACDGFQVLQAPQFWGMAGKIIASWFRALKRQAISPITTPSSPTSKLRLERGMRISANHPSPLMCVSTSQKVSQSKSAAVAASLAMAPSVLEPVGLARKPTAFSLSWKVSRMRARKSLSAPVKFRRNEVADGGLRS